MCQIRVSQFGKEKIRSPRKKQPPPLTPPKDLPLVDFHCGRGFLVWKMPSKARIRYWIGFLLATVLCQGLFHLRVSEAKKERRKLKEPNQYTEPFNTTLSNSEELNGHSKVCAKIVIIYFQKTSQFPCGLVYNPLRGSGAEAVSPTSVAACKPAHLNSHFIAGKLRFQSVQ